MVNDDATVQLLVGSSDIGQGSETMESQIAAESLGISLEDVHIKTADTGLTPYDTGTFGSSQTFICGNAVVRVCDDLKRKILAQLRVIYPDAEVEQLGKRYLVEANGEKTGMTFSQAIHKIMFAPWLRAHWRGYLQSGSLPQSIFRLLCQGGIP